MTRTKKYAARMSLSAWVIDLKSARSAVEEPWPASSITYSAGSADPKSTRTRQSLMRAPTPVLFPLLARMAGPRQRTGGSALARRVALVRPPGGPRLRWFVAAAQRPRPDIGARGAPRDTGMTGSELHQLLDRVREGLLA